MQLRSFTLAAALVAATLAPAAAAPAARSFDLVTYAPPDGFTLQEAGDHVAMVRQGSKSYCIIAIFGSQDAAGGLDASFAAAWKSIALRAVDPAPVPATQHAQIGGADAVVGGAMTTTKGTPLLVMLSTIDAGAKTISVLVMTPSADDLKVYTPAIQSLLTSMTVTRVAPAAAAAPAAPAAPDTSAAPPGAMPYGDQVPPPARPLTVADLAGEWGHGGAASNTYVDSRSGVYAGYTSVQYETTRTITAKGVITTESHGVTSGYGGTHGHADKHVAAITVDPDGSITIVEKGREVYVTHYLIRGWKVTPDATYLRVVGPFYADGIPDDVRQDPHKAGNLEEVWVRKGKGK